MKICIKCIYGFTESASIASTVSVICMQIIGFEIVLSNHVLNELLNACTVASIIIYVKQNSHTISLRNLCKYKVTSYPDVVSSS